MSTATNPLVSSCWQLNEASVAADYLKKIQDGEMSLEVTRAEIEAAAPSRRSADAPACIKVSGFKLLIRLYAPTKRKDSLIELPQDAAELHGRASIISQVMELGPDAYVATDARPWPSGRLCQPDDWIVCRSYTGTRLKIGGHEYRIINDDQVEAVVADPEQVERAI